MLDGYPIDVRVFLIAVQRQIAIALWNLKQSATKLAMDAESFVIVQNTIAHVLDQAVASGNLAPGFWVGEGFEDVQDGTYLAKGYKIFMPDLSKISQAKRQKGELSMITILMKGAGEVETFVIRNIYQS